MKSYVRIDNGVVMEVIEGFRNEDGQEVPIEERFPPEVVETLVEITNEDPKPDQAWTYIDGKFAKPKPPEPTQEELLNIFNSTKATQLAKAVSQISWLQDAVDLGEDEEGDAEKLLEWKRYRIALNRLVFPSEFPKSPDEA